jgi:YbbR domain-containing protein
MIRFVTRNFGIKLFSLAIAILLWAVLSGSRESTASISAPVQYRNIPKSLEISSEIVEQVHLLLRGPSLSLTRLSNNDVPVVLDLSQVKGPGETTFTISLDNVALPSGVLLERAIPGQVRLRLETRVALDVPVRVRYEYLPAGMEIAEEEVIPPRLQVIGPESRISTIQFVETDPVDLRMLDGNGEATTAAFAGDPQVIFTGSSLVRVRVTLRPKPALD